MLYTERKWRTVKTNTEVCCEKIHIAPIFSLVGCVVQHAYINKQYKIKKHSAKHAKTRIMPSLDLVHTCSRRRNLRRWLCSPSRSTYSRSSSISSFTCCTVSSSCLMATMSRFTSLTSLWHDSTDLVSSCSCDRISHSATVVSSCRSPRCSSSSFALRFMLMTLTCFCRLQPCMVLGYTLRMALALAPTWHDSTKYLLMATQFVLYTAVHKCRKHGYRRHNTNKSTELNIILGCLSKHSQESESQIPGRAFCHFKTLYYNNILKG